MDIETFEMERMQSAYEREVEVNLSESGVHALTVSELLDDTERAEFLKHDLGYPEPPGSDLLRERIAAWYPGATIDNVTVTNGGAEANFLVLWTLLSAGDRLAFMRPNYMQGWGLGRAFGESSDPFHLVLSERPEGRRWELDVDELERQCSAETKVILVCNPNNPTAAVLSEEEMKAVVTVARRCDAYIVADEIYRGAELDGGTTPTFWGRYEKVVITSGLSKAFGLPGLRLGWTVAPTDVLRDVWRHRDYTTLMVGVLSDELASRALEPSTRDSILERTRSIIRRNVTVVNEWAAMNEGLVRYGRPRAGAITYFEYDLPFTSSELANRIREEESVLVVPGDQLGLSKGFRIGFGHGIDKTREGLQRIEKLFRRLDSA